MASFYPWQVYYAWSVFRRNDLLKLELRPGDWENLAFGGMLVITSWSIFLKVWTYDNGLMMAALGMALLSGLGLAELERRSLPAPAAQTKNAGQAAALLLGIIQLAILIYNPVEQIPAQKDKVAGEAFVGRLEQLFGEVLVFNHGFYSHLAGKTDIPA